MKKLYVVCLSALLLVAGCSKGDTSTVEQTVCQIEANGVTMTYTMDHEADKVLKQSVSNKLVYADVEGQTMTKELMEAAGAQAASQLNTIKGISYEYVATDKDYTETTVVDYVKADLAELIDLGIVAYPGEDVKEISLKVVVDAYTAAGFECK